MRITFVLGCSAAGKTSLHHLLLSDGLAGRVAAHPDPLTIRELDDVDGGIPLAADTHWLQWRAANELAHAADAAVAGIDGHRVITGIVWPFALVQDNAWRAAQDAGVDVRFVLLDRPWPEIAASLDDRLADWAFEERTEQIDNNRRLQRSLANQVRALHAGTVVLGGDLDAAVDVVLDGPVTTFGTLTES